MECEKCKAKMNWNIEGASQGWWCPVCGWSIVTTYIDDINFDMTEYSLYIKNESEIDREKSRLLQKLLSCKT